MDYPVATTASAPGVLRRVRLDVLAIVLALLGGALGTIGALVQELQSLSGGVILVVLGAPIVEEALKPTGIYLLLLRWPQALRGRLHTAVLGALAGLVFGLIESWVYVTLYYTDASSDYVLFRYTVPVAMHATASFIVSLGLNRGLIDWAAGRVPLPRSTRNFFLAGASLHAIYNIAVIALSVSGLVDFAE